MGKITINELHNSLFDYVQTVSDNKLETNNKTIVGAINELFSDNSNDIEINNLKNEISNGKQLIASAIGEPLNAEDTFSAMSNDINSLLSTFKTNMMNNGITVESGDKFKSLIDKIATMVEEGEGKGIHIENGIVTSNRNGGLTIPLQFEPIVVFTYQNETGTNGITYPTIYGKFDDNILSVRTYNNGSTTAANIVSSSYTNGSFTTNTYTSNMSCTYYAIGVGEEDTTLRDSLKSILAEEGVTTTEEDDMASLITKVDNEFNEKNNELSEYESNKDELINIMTNMGYELNGNESISELINILQTVKIEDSIIKIATSMQGCTYMINSRGEIAVTGIDSSGETGLGLYNGTTLQHNIFTKIDIENVKHVAAGMNHVMILKNNGELWCCGRHNSGQLGIEGLESYYINTLTKHQVTDVKHVACGENHTVILKNDGTVWACGYNGSGQLGVGNYTNSSTFKQLNITDVREISVDYENTIALKNDGTVWGCGDNYYNQLAIASDSQYSPYVSTIKNLGLSDVKSVSVGHQYIMIVKNDGTVWGCGYDEYKQLGTGRTESNVSISSFKQAVNVANASSIICGRSHSIIMTNDGKIYGAGNNTGGQLGLGDCTYYQTFTEYHRGI